MKYQKKNQAVFSSYFMLTFVVFDVGERSDILLRSMPKLAIMLFSENTIWILLPMYKILSIVLFLFGIFRNMIFLEH